MSKNKRVGFEVGSRMARDYLDRPVGEDPAMTAERDKLDRLAKEYEDYRQVARKLGLSADDLYESAPEPGPSAQDRAIALSYELAGQQPVGGEIYEDPELDPRVLMHNDALEVRRVMAGLDEPVMPVSMRPRGTPRSATPRPVDPSNFYLGPPPPPQYFPPDPPPGPHPDFGPAMSYDPSYLRSLDTWGR